MVGRDQDVEALGAKVSNRLRCHSQCKESHRKDLRNVTSPTAFHPLSKTTRTDHLTLIRMAMERKGGREERRKKGREGRREGREGRDEKRK